MLEFHQDSLPMIMSACREGMRLITGVDRLTALYDDPKLNGLRSHEHEVLKVSYCGQSMSVVRRPSCVVRRPSCVVRRPSCSVNNCFKSLLLLHPWAN